MAAAWVGRPRNNAPCTELSRLHIPGRTRQSFDPESGEPVWLIAPICVRARAVIGSAAEKRFRIGAESELEGISQGRGGHLSRGPLHGGLHVRADCLSYAQPGHGAPRASPLRRQ